MWKKIIRLFKEIKEDELYEFRFSGVWAMFGIDKTDDKRNCRCLNVGKSIDVGKELKADIERLTSFKECIEDRKEYRNQFNEVMFTYPVYASRLDWLYEKISEKYEAIFWILIAEQDSYVIEKYFAYSTKAAYWVSNGRYSLETKVDIDKIRGCIDVSSIDKGLVDKIDDLRELMKNNF